ncbi:MAG: prolyl oligopeptidase family serine peptidase, partial [Planctomycetota bacterium]
HLVSLLGTAEDETTFDVGENKEESARVQAVCNYFGPTDFAAFAQTPGYEGADDPNGAVGKLLDGAPSEETETAKAASPVTYVSADDPPFLILHGTEDPLVPLDQSERLYSALQRAGVPATLVVFPGAGHGGGPFVQPRTTARIAEFFARHLRAEEMP